MSGTNCPDGELVDSAVEFAAFDGLHPSLRQTIANAAFSWKPSDIVAACRGRGMTVRDVRRFVRQLDENAIRDDAAAYRRRYRIRLPHEAAHATILRSKPL